LGLEQIITLNISKNTKVKGSILIISVLGLGLRLFQLGKDSFWCDEAGVAVVAIQPSISDAYSEMLTHAMAMPLDYAISWLIAQFTLSEFFLRFPSVIWGVATLIVSYILFSQICNRSVALLGSCLLALSPLHIQFSQELRFYSALIFFYTLSSLLLFEAIRHNRRIYWLAFLFVTSIGIYFHIYVILSLVNGVAWFLRSEFKNSSTKFKKYMVVSIFLITLSFIGYLLFGARQAFDMPLLQYHEFWRGILLGFGWIPTTADSWPWNYLWGGITLLFFLVGMYVVFSQRLEYLRETVVSIFLQFGIIIIADMFKGYWFVYRQLLIFLPLTLLISALGLWSVFRRFRWGNVMIYILCFMAWMPSLAYYYRWPKSLGREIVQQLDRHWIDGDVFLITYTCEKRMYDFYLTRIGRHDISQSSIAIPRTNINDTLINLEKHNRTSGDIYISVAYPTPADYEMLTQLGYSSIIYDSYTGIMPQQLFAKNTVSP
jgi:4-amino-4-deoxy-L-arabinose transferase-like glycosyltransferase